jgi:hypothetical protein
MEEFNPKKPNEVDSKEQNQLKILNRFTALKNLHDDMDINRTWKSTEETMEASARVSSSYCN